MDPNLQVRNVEYYVKHVKEKLLSPIKMNKIS